MFLIPLKVSTDFRLSWADISVAAKISEFRKNLKKKMKNTHT